MTWQPIHVWAIPTFAEDEMFFTIQADGLYAPPETRGYWLELVYAPEDIEGAPPIGTRWDVPLEEPLTISLPTYRADSGEGAYQLAFTVGAEVPEPNCLFTILTGSALLLPHWRLENRPARPRCNAKA